MKERKVSFLIAAHNEEKIIKRTIENLINLPCKNYEVLIGLDGCTDNTEKIVRAFSEKSEKIRYYELNLRKGKPFVINYLIKKATGQIIIIQDADWIFKIDSENSFKKFLGVFDDPEIGGIAESFPVEWEVERIKNSNWVYKMVAYSTFLWMKYQKEKLSKKERDFLLMKRPTMFLTNIFRKKLYRDNVSLGDDFERTQHIFSKGYKIALFPQENMPRMVAIYDEIKFKDFFRQKIRTAIARRQLNKSKSMPTNMGEYYLPSVFFIFLNSWKISFYIGFLITVWIVATSFATFISEFKSLDTRKGWSLRAERT